MTAMLTTLNSLEWTGFPRRAAVLVTALGLMVLTGWALDVPLLKSFIPGLIEMKANTALCFLLAGSAVLLRETEGFVAARAYTASAPVRETRMRLFQVFGEMEEEECRLHAERSTEQSRVCEQLMIGRG